MTHGSESSQGSRYRTEFKFHKKDEIASQKSKSYCSHWCPHLNSKNGDVLFDVQ